MLGLEQRLHQYEPLFGGWYLRGEIGSGSYGRVYRVENQNLFGVTYTAALKAIEILPRTIKICWMRRSTCAVRHMRRQ